eukprot:9254079-Lingulodinium_polyedra.AAC.1
MRWSRRLNFSKERRAAVFELVGFIEVIELIDCNELVKVNKFIELVESIEFGAFVGFSKCIEAIEFI